MFCDEPTSGLDSFMAQNIVQVFANSIHYTVLARKLKLERSIGQQAMRDLARMGKAVICTIHQPSSEVFEMFDQILLMADGRPAFMGPIAEALPFFSSHGMPCPANYNPADFYIFTLAIVPGQEAACKQKVKYICDAYENSEFRRRIDKIVKQDYVPNQELLKKKKDRSPYKAGWFSQFGAVFWRSWISVFREPQMLIAKGGTAIVIILGAVILFIV